jgi:hypothetical protein
MIVDDLHVIGFAVAPSKDDPPLIVDPDRMEASETTGESALVSTLQAALSAAPPLGGSWRAFALQTIGLHENVGRQIPRA